MDVLNLSDTALDILPDFSRNRITSLNLSWNYIRVLYEDHLPTGIQNLDLQGNQIQSDGLLQVWPNSIEQLNLSRNNFYSLDEVFNWPNSLRVLNLSRTNLESLNCSRLPESLEELDISHTFIKTLSKFPSNLKRFNAIYVELKSLPFRCPDSLEEFVFSFTRHSIQRRMLPSYWGKSLRILDLKGLGIKNIPTGLPDTLENANFSNNFIQEIPSGEKIPSSLKFLHLGKNKIRVIPSWMFLRTNLKFTIQNNFLTEFPKSSNCILSYSQWVGEIYTEAARKFQKAWRIQRIPPAIRTWKRVRTLKYDLLALAMCPERAGRFEDISPEWKYEYRGP